MGCRCLRYLACMALACSPFLAAPRGARAGEVMVRIDAGPGAQFAQQAGYDLATFEAQLKREIESLFQVMRVGEYVQSFGDAQAFTTKGLGVDYASNLKLIEVGFTAALSLNVEDNFTPENTRGKPPISGIGGNATLMAGLNLGFLGLAPVTVFGNAYRRDGSFGGNQDFDVELRNYGLHAHVKLFRPEGSLILGSIRWGGLAVTSGFDYSRLHLKLARKNLKTEIPFGQAMGQTAQVIVDSMGTFDIDASSWSVPLELTTSIRLFWLATLYGGLGFDWQFTGENTLTLSLNGTMTGLVGGTSDKLGDAVITATDKGDPSPGRLRGLVGLQTSLWILRLFAQLNFVPGSPTLAGLAFGARAAW